MSGGRKQAPGPVRAEFWERVRSGLPPRDAGAAMGVRKGAERWFALAGGVKSNGPGLVTGRTADCAARAPYLRTNQPASQAGWVSGTSVLQGSLAVVGGLREVGCVAVGKSRAPEVP